MGKFSQPHYDLTIDDALFQGNHPKMAAIFRLVKDRNLPRWIRLICPLLLMKKKTFSVHWIPKFKPCL